MRRDFGKSFKRQLQWPATCPLRRANEGAPAKTSVTNLRQIPVDYPNGRNVFHAINGLRAVEEVTG
jgi:hypothetical protein